MVQPENKILIKNWGDKFEVHIHSEDWDMPATTVYVATIAYGPNEVSAIKAAIKRLDKLKKELKRKL